MLRSTTRRWLAARLALVTSAALLSASSPASSADIKVECVAASEQGQQLRDDGKYRLAREQFQSCSRDACPRVVSRLCTQWAHDLDLNMPTIVVGARDAQGADVVDARATLDGDRLADQLDGKPVNVDPGVHVLRVSRDGSVAAEQKIVVRAGEKSRVVTVTLTATTSTSPPVGPPGAPAEPARSSGAAGRIATGTALFVGAAGAIGSAVYLGLHSSSEADAAATVRGSIPSTACAHATSPACQSLSNDVDAQNRDATISRVLYVTGAALALGAGAAWLFWPRAKSAEAAHTWVAPWGSPRAGGLGFGTAF
jgi:hypothetical protein